MATHSSTLAWEIPATEETVGYSPRGRKELDTTAQLSRHTHTRPNILHFADCSCNLHCVFFSGIALLLEDKLYSRLLSIFIINNRTVILEAQQEQQ